MGRGRGPGARHAPGQGLGGARSPGCVSSCSSAGTSRGASSSTRSSPFPTTGHSAFPASSGPASSPSSSMRPSPGGRSGASAMARQNRPYLFHDTTGTVCTTCLRPAEGKILLRDRAGGAREVVPGPWLRAGATGRRRLLVPDGTRGLRQGPGAAGALRHPDGVRLPVRLRPLPGPHAALLRHRAGGDRPLQPALPGLLRGLRSRAIECIGRWP